MRKGVVVIVLLVAIVLVVGCGPKSQGEVFDKNKVVVEKAAPVDKTIKKVVKNKTVVAKPKMSLSCTHNKNCTGGKLCVQGNCKLLTDFYKSEGCAKKCNFKDVSILTSDGETYTLARGKGSYTAGSALSWTIMPGKDYCQGEKIIVPIKVLKRNYNLIVSDEVILLNVGETSKVLTHPLIRTIAFTLRVNSVKEVCS